MQQPDNLSQQIEPRWTLALKTQYDGLSDGRVQPSLRDARIPHRVFQALKDRTKVGSTLRG